MYSKSFFVIITAIFIALAVKFGEMHNIFMMIYCGFSAGSTLTLMFTPKILRILEERNRAKSAAEIIV